MIRGRDDLALASRIVIKAGTSVVSTPDGYPSLSRMANIVEHAARLVREGKEVLIVTSGAVGVGRQRLSKQAILRRSMNDLITQRDPSLLNSVGISAKSSKSYSSACAAAGQLGLMALYETMFSQFDITVSQLLVTSFDFTSPERRRNVQHVISQLLALGIVPLLNENDAVSANQGYETFGTTFSDNDSLASLVAVEMSAQLLILLTDVKGVYDRPPTDPEAKIIDVFRESTGFKEGNKSLQGRGGMGAKVDAALNAVRGGVQAVVIAAGHDSDTIGSVLNGDKVGTLFLDRDSAVATPSEETTAQSTAVEDTLRAIENSIGPEYIAQRAREGSRQLVQVDATVRANILKAIANRIDCQRDRIFTANQQDIAAAEKSCVSTQLLNRLKLTTAKLTSLIDGIRMIADAEDRVFQVQSRSEVTDDLILDKVCCPIGVLLVIFESRPDCLPQIAALAIKSGNGLVLKGGKEAEQTNDVLHQLIQEAIISGSDSKVSGDVIGMVTSRADVQELLALDQYIDLIIPRGSNQLVKSIQSSTKIPVLGHADGVCHLYVDEFADESKALRIVTDSKYDYPSACNAAETLLLHRSHVSSGLADKILRSLRKVGVTVYGSLKALSIGLAEQIVLDMHTEYGDLKISVDVVDSMEEAIAHIHRHGSGHTECIVTEDHARAESFLRSVDSACVFHNASTRFADGYRFGLGAEVGISTGRIHARGPVGVEGLLTSKWMLRSSSREGHIVASNSTSPYYESNAGAWTYTHKKISLG